MANFQTSQDLVAAVLNISGEVTDGTSNYQADALTYLNIAYKNVLSGGSIYGVDVAEPWTWAVATRPIILTLEPSIETVAVSATLGSTAITFSATPTDAFGNSVSLYKWWLNIAGQDEWYQIRAHTGGQLSASIDAPFPLASVTAASCVLVKLDYDLIDDSILIDVNSQFLDFAESTGAIQEAIVQPGFYTPQTFATAVGTAMTSQSTNGTTYSVTWSETTRLFTIFATNSFTMLGASGANASLNFLAQLGLDVLDVQSVANFNGYANSIIGTYPLNAINRLTAPMLCYQKPSDSWRSASTEGKIFELSFNTFVREYPLTMLTADVPDKFCVVSKSKTGIVSIRFNGYLCDFPTKVEVGYIPKHRALQNNAVSVPVLPEEHREIIVDMACARLMKDKTDSKAVDREAMAKAGLQALMNASRKDKSLAGNNYGKLIPRAGRTRRRWWWSIT